MVEVVEATKTQPERFVLDGNIFDKIVEDELMFELVRELDRVGAIELLVTRKQNDELVEIPDAEKREKIAQVPRKSAPCTNAVLGEMTLGSARLGTTGRISDAVGDADRVVGGEAKAQGLRPVSEDRRFRNGALREGLEPWDWDAFATHLRSLAGEGR